MTPSLRKELLIRIFFLNVTKQQNRSYTEITISLGLLKLKIKLTIPNPNTGILSLPRAVPSLRNKCGVMSVY